MSFIAPPPAPALRTARRTAPVIRIAHLDDHLATRAGLRALVKGEPDLISVGAAADEAELWTLVRRTHPSLVVLDSHRPGGDGLLLCFALKAMVPALAVLVYTGATRDLLSVAARMAGADGVVTKTNDRRALLEAIRRADRGPEGPMEIAPSLRTRAALGLDPVDRAIFAMRLAGTPAHDIATTTGLSTAVVAGRIASIVRHLSSPAPEPASLTATTGRTAHPCPRGTPTRPGCGQRTSRSTSGSSRTLAGGHR